MYSKHSPPPSRKSFKDQANRLIDMGYMALSAHARQRMMERDVNMAEVINCIRKGHVVEDPYIDIKGRWRASMQRATDGRRIDVVLAAEEPPRLVVVTVF